MSTIWLARHAQAEGGEDADPGLSDLGRAQAAALGRRLLGSGVVEVRHGPKRRAAETARIAADVLGVDAVETALLDDLTAVPSAGRRSGFLRWELDRLDQVPEAERDEDGARMTAAWHRLQAPADERPVLLVTHAFVVSWFVAEALGLRGGAWLRLTAANAGLTALDPDPARGAFVRSFNDTGHLIGLDAR